MFILSPAWSHGKPLRLLPQLNNQIRGVEEIKDIGERMEEAVSKNSARLKSDEELDA